MTRSRIIGCGKALPKQAVTNADLVARGIDTSDDWIVERTGIKQRYIAGEGETTGTLAIAAATDALRHAGVTADSIDMIVLATTTPDNTFPATAVKVQAALGLPAHSFAFDVQAVCSGFVYALATADNFIRAGQAKRALVIGAETFTRLLDWNDRTTCVLFGDGAGAVVLEAYDGTDKGIISTHLHSDGKQYGLLYADGGASTTRTTGVTKMEGQEVFKHAVRRLAEVVEETLAANNLPASAIDWLVPHQANKRIIDGTAKKLNLPSEKVVLTVSQHGNTSAASIPLALATAAHDGRLKPGQLVLLEAMGGGFTWGAALVRWG
jgi:3-oxoacyl-[acyl-carrier-protein] synthase-3